MAKRVSLTVNNVSIKLDYFVHKYIAEVVSGIVASLHDTGEIENLELTIDNNGHVAINLNNSAVWLKEFPIDIIGRTVMGMVAPLKGVDGEIRSLKLNIRSR